MSYKIKKRYAKKGNYGGKRSTKDIKWIVIHWTGNDGDSDESNANYFATGLRYASAHAFVDDDSVSISVPANYISWSVGVDYQDQSSPYKKYGRKYAGKANNNNTYNIELCDTIKDCKHVFSDDTINNAVSYTKKAMKKYGIDSDHVIRHFDVTGKICPHPFVVSNSLWKEFKANLNCPQKIKTTRNNVICRDKTSDKYNRLGSLKKGTTCIIDKIKIVNGIFYGHRKKADNWIRLKNTTYKKL